ncbi:hypothetical protein SMACR_05759 [Sordaria macrospora]|uniref:WGS project CABT00000000 data, contig 2.6 n=2 Tax=Sordaria macrospora TaxID=5147 RepID=F7VT59_SORMK|nr:uncharacterized protein SMAC_05759 [Sordaria macrospora k-hell]KAA8631013.1 hypothetical protein SMACR_05759 [Sordaria macrospora]KAH7626580.1 hypothetical protein B0T09DRAFT_272060 [Sordaria sp. MPI-SDFR-AT-0083]WPJ57877.1 hypothetical protein SMAC4_05759 [Sordaria macrospora]CCC08514.1 unnamed protein product [Sordaria macrospora k-hell]
MSLKASRLMASGVSHKVVESDLRGAGAAPPHHGSKEMGLSSLDMDDDDDDDDDDEEGRNPRQVYACKPGDPYPGGQLPRISLGRCCGAFTARSDGDRLRHF